MQLNNVGFGVCGLYVAGRIRAVFATIGGHKGAYSGRIAEIPPVITQDFSLKIWQDWVCYKNDGIICC